MANHLRPRHAIGLSLAATLLLVPLACSQGTPSRPATAAVDAADEGGAAARAGTSAYMVTAWNDLGMHCLNPSYDAAVILPPYNTVWAQVVKKGNPPQLVTAGLTAEYRILNNSYSYGKRSYGQFWDFALRLFGAAPARDKGLNLVDPAISNGLTGTMVAKGDHFEVDGIPLVPVDDRGTWNPYQVAQITIKDSRGAIVAQTQATVPTSDEISCNKCHGQDAFHDILRKHDRRHGTSLFASQPVLCASCHGSPALGQSGPGSSGKYLSQAMHGFHASKGAACYDCHPGASTKCSRSLAHTAADGNCTACHGSMTEVASSIAAGRVPWVGEPACAKCHAGVAEVDTGPALYRRGKGHGGLACPSCHGSPHAMVPTSQASDNYQAIQYQGKAKALGSCAACHDSNKGEGFREFAQEHGSGGRNSACSMCHTGFQNVTLQAKWPHAFQWKTRTGSGGTSGD